MKANREQTAVKITVSKMGTHTIVRVVTKYGKQYLHEVVTQNLIIVEIASLPCEHVI